MTKLVTFAVLAASALCAGTTTNAAALGEDLVGTWAWESVDNTHSDGAKTQPFGPKPGGYLIFDKSGGFFWLITRPGRAKFASGRRDQGTLEENKETVCRNLLCFAGTFAI